MPRKRLCRKEPKENLPIKGYVKQEVVMKDIGKQWSQSQEKVLIVMLGLENVKKEAQDATENRNNQNKKEHLESKNIKQLK